MVPCQFLISKKENMMTNELLILNQQGERESVRIQQRITLCQGMTHQFSFRIYPSHVENHSIAP